LRTSACIYSKWPRALTSENFSLDPKENPDSADVATGNVQAAVKAICDALNNQVMCVI
jgi:hypothetical protein